MDLNVEPELQNIIEEVPAIQLPQQTPPETPQGASESNSEPSTSTSSDIIVIDNQGAITLGESGNQVEQK